MSCAPHFLDSYFKNINWLGEEEQEEEEEDDGGGGGGRFCPF